MSYNQWCIENDLLDNKPAQKVSNQTLSTLHIQVTRKQMTLKQIANPFTLTTVKQKVNPFTLTTCSKENQKRRKKVHKNWINNIDSTRSRVHRIPSRHMFRVGTRPYKWLEASQRQNGLCCFNKLTPDWLLWLRGPAVRPLIHGTEASLVPFGNINWV